MCVCRDIKLCEVARVYETELLSCFPEYSPKLYTMEVYASEHEIVNKDDLLFEICSTGMRIWEHDIALYEFDAKNNENLQYFYFNCLNKSRLMRALNDIGKSFYDYHAAQKVYFYESLQNHNIWWNYRDL